MGSKEKEDKPEVEEDKDIVTPWTVSTSNASGINYNKLIGSHFYFIIACSLHFQRNLDAFHWEKI
jgi:hypothetical protein